MATGNRSTYGVSIAVTGSTGARVVTVSLSGSLPGGTYNSATRTVVASSNTVTINLAG